MVLYILLSTILLKEEKPGRHSGIHHKSSEYRREMFKLKANWCAVSSAIKRIQTELEEAEHVSKAMFPWWRKKEKVGVILVSEDPIHSLNLAWQCPYKISTSSQKADIEQISLQMEPIL